MTSEEAALARRLAAEAQARRPKRMTNVEIAEKADVNERTVREVLNGPAATLETAIGILAVLDVDFRAELKKVRPISDDRKAAHVARGAYSRHIYEKYEGLYLTVRPGYANHERIKIYFTELSWDEDADCLQFQEIGREDNLGHNGTVYIAPGSPYFYLMSIETGFVRTILVSHSDSSGGSSSDWRGLILSQYNSHGPHYTPICAPILYIRKPSAGIEAGEIGSDHPAYADLAARLRAVVDDGFARFAVLGMSDPTG